MLRACELGSLEDVISLCEDGKFDELFEKDSRLLYTPFMVACLRDHTSVVEYILSKQNIPSSAFHEVVDPDDTGEIYIDENSTPMKIFCRRGNLSIVQLLFSLGTPMGFYLTCAEMSSPFIYALESNNIYLVKFLLEHITRLQDMSLSQFFNNDDGFGSTPVHFACAYGLIDILAHMIVAGANLCVVNWSGETPLSLACRGNHVEIVRLLMETESRNDVLKFSVLDKKNPFFISFANDNVDIAALLKPCVSDEVIIQVLSHLLIDPLLSTKYKMISWITRPLFELTRSSSTIYRAFMEALQGAFYESLDRQDWRRVHFYINEAFDCDPQEVFSTFFVGVVRAHCMPCMKSLDVSSLRLFIQFGLLEGENDHFDLDLASLIYCQFKYKFDSRIGAHMNEIVWIHSSMDNGFLSSLMPPRIDDFVIKTIVSFVCVVLKDEQWKRIQRFLEIIYQTCYCPDKQMKKQKELKKKILNGLSYISNGISDMIDFWGSLKPRYDLRSRKRPKIEDL